MINDPAIRLSGGCMKKLSCVLLSIVLMLSLSACSDDKTRLYAGACTYYADGGLMSFSEYVYKYDKNGNQVKECAYYNGSLKTTTEREYDPSGSFTEKKTDSRDNVEYLREYDKNGVIRKETTYDYDGEVEEVTEYNEAGLPVRKESFSWTYTVEYEYDDKGKLQKEIETDYDDNNVVGNIYEDIYDSEGERIQRTITSPDGSTVLAERCETVEDGNKKTVNQYDSNDELRYVTEKEYDAKGNLLKKISYSIKNGDREFLSSSEYTYDKESRVIDFVYVLGDRTETKYEYSDEGYLSKESIITEKRISSAVYSDGSDAELKEVITVNHYNADGEKTGSEYFVGGELSSYTEYFYESVKVRSGSKSQFDFRDKKRKLDERSNRVY